MAEWLTEGQLLESVGLTRAELHWYAAQFSAQMRCLVSAQPDGGVRYAPDAVPLLRGLSAMVAQGASPEQIKTWFGL